MVVIHRILIVVQAPGFPDPDGGVTVPPPKRAMNAALGVFRSGCLPTISSSLEEAPHWTVPAGQGPWSPTAAITSAAAPVPAVPSSTMTSSQPPEASPIVIESRRLAAEAVRRQEEASQNATKKKAEAAEMAKQAAKLKATAIAEATAIANNMNATSPGGARAQHVGEPSPKRSKRTGKGAVEPAAAASKRSSSMAPEAETQALRIEIAALHEQLGQVQAAWKAEMLGGLSLRETALQLRAELAKHEPPIVDLTAERIRTGFGAPAATTPSLRPVKRNLVAEQLHESLVVVKREIHTAKEDALDQGELAEVLTLTVDERQSYEDVLKGQVQKPQQAA